VGSNETQYEQTQRLGTPCRGGMAQGYAVGLHFWETRCINAFQG
jgi:hypothetical protein